MYWQLKLHNLVKKWFGATFASGLRPPMRGRRRPSLSRILSRLEVLESRIVPASFTPGDLVVLQAAASANNTTGSILEIAPTTANQASPVLTVAVSGTGTNAIRISGSASTTGYLADANDGTSVEFTGANSTSTSTNANTLNPRAVVALDNAGDVTLPATYTGTSGNQTRGASTLDDSDYTIGDQGGIYTNDSTTASPSGNILSVKSFGGTTYAFTASKSIPSVGTLSSPSGSTLTPLPGLPDGPSAGVDFYLIQSGSNGSTFDVLYILAESNANSGTIAKYSLVDGSWVANGSYTTGFGGFGLAAANDGSGGADLYVTTGSGATTANQVIQLTDTAGYNAGINITTANNVTLYTTPAGTILKGIAFAPVAATATTTTVTNVTPLNASSTQSVSLTATVTATSGSSAPGSGIVEFINGGASGTVLGTATSATINGTTSTFSITTVEPVGTYNDIQAYYITNSGSGFSSSVSAAYGSTLAVGIATTTALTSITPTSSVAGQPISFTATVSANSGSTAPSAGSVQFFDGTTDTLLATATAETVNGTTATFTVTTSSIAAGTYSDIQAFYIGGTGFVDSNSSVYGTALALNPPGVITEWTFPVLASSPDNSPAPTYGTGTAITLGMTNDYNSGNAASDDVLSTSGTANANFSEDTWRIRGVINDGWASAAAGAAEYSQGIEVDTSTVGYSNIIFSFDWYSTSDGIRDLQVQYNTDINNPDGWTNYQGPSPTGTFVATPGDYYNADLSPDDPTITINLSSIAAANNDPNFGIRLVAAFDSTGNVPNDYASATLGSNGLTVPYDNDSGNWRFGNLTFSYGTTTSTAVTANPTGSQGSGGSVTFTATVTPASGNTNPTGTVAFYSGATQIGTTQTLTAGSGNTSTASISINSLAVGAQDITAVYVAAAGSGFINSGSSMNLTVGTNPIAYIVLGVNTTSAVTTSAPSPQPLGSTITFTDTITPASGSVFPSGTVKFYDNGSKIGSTQTVVAGTGNTGTASITISTLGLGDNDITAEYFPTSDFGASTSPILDETIIPNLSGPIITEFVASNGGDLLDAAGATPDWLEIYNPTSTIIDLYGYALTDSSTNLNEYVFPQYTLAAGAYLVVFCDSLNVITPTEVHTNFNIGASGGYLALVNPAGTVITQYQYPAQYQDISYGMEFNGSTPLPGTVAYFAKPTPDAPNTNPYTGIAGTVAASVPAGFYTNGMSVTLTTTPGAKIYYTLNGSAPTTADGIVYTGALNISSTTTLRAEAYAPGYFSQASATWTYIYVADVVTQSLHDAPGYPTVGAAPAGWPTSWGPNDVDYGLDETVIQDEGVANVEAALTSLPAIAISTGLGGLFNASTGIYANASGHGQIAASIALINPDGVTGFQINAGLSIRGGFSRTSGNPKHSFHITFSSDYGPSTLDYPIFGDQPGVATSFQGIDLRTAQNNSWSAGGDPNMTMIEDPFERASQGAMGTITTHSIWVNLYIDGQYWGIYEIEERVDPLFAATYLNEPTTDTYDILRAENGSYTIGVVDGNENAYEQLWSYVTTQNMANNATYYFIQGENAQGQPDPSIPNSDVLLNVPNLIDYMITVYQGGNLDGPISTFLGDTGINNFFAVRDEDGREGFVFIQHDDEWTIQSDSADRIGPFDAGGPGDFEHFNPQYLFQVLTANAEFRQTFADMVQEDFYGDGPMTNAAMLARYEANVQDLSTAIIGESARWGDAQSLTDPLTVTDWVNAVANQESVLLNRNAVVLQQFVAAGWLPSLAAPSLLVDDDADIPDEITPGSLLTFANTVGTIYFTTDGSDPRLVGGAINPLAQVYTPGQSEPALVINSSTEVNARVLDGTTWSPLSTAELSTAVAATAGNLAITELQYDPLADATATTAPDNDAQNFEYIELRDIGSQAINLSGVQFTQGITFDFSSGNVLFLNPGQSVVVVSNLQAFEDRYGTAALVAGVYEGDLKNSGATLTLMDAAGAVIQSFTYSDSSSWPQTPHGDGPSLTVINVNGDYDDSTNWRASYAALGTPGYNEGVDTVPTGAPTGLQATPSGYTSTSTGAVTVTNLLTWTGLSDVTEYIIERATSPDGTFVQIGTSDEANFTDSGLTPGTTYYYQVCGVNAVGNGPFSAVLPVTIPTVPAAPTAAEVTSVTSTSIALTWTDNADNEDGFQIYRSANGGAYALVGNVAADTNAAPSAVSYTDTGLTPGVTYAYEIVAYNLAGASGSADVTNTTLLAAPDLVFSQRNSNSATLFFSEPTGATSYNIYRGTASGQETLLATGVTSSPYTDSTLQTGVTYYYYVTAVNANAVPAPNESAPSNETAPSTGGGAFQWTGDGSNNNWTTAANWLGGVAPTGNANETLIFPPSAKQLTNVDNFAAGSNFFNDIIVTGAGYSFTIKTSLALGASGILVSGSGTNTFAGATSSVGIFLATDATFNVATGAALIVNMPVVELSDTLTLVGAGSDTLNGTLEGTGGLVIASQGTVTINGANTYTGATLVNSGTVNLANDTAFGVNNDVTIAQSATVVLQGAISSGVGLQGQYYNESPNSSDFVSLPTLSTYISGLTPSLTELSSATSLNGNFDFGDSGSSFPAPYNANATEFIAIFTGLFDAPTTGTYTFDTGSDDGSMLFIDGNVVVNNNNFQVLTVNSGTVYLTAGEHNIVIAYYQGSGDYALYADVQIPGGSLERLPDSLLSTTVPSDVQFGSLSGSGTLQLGSNEITIGGDGNSSTFTGVLSGTGGVTKVGADTLVLGQPQYTGVTTISAGTLQFGDGVDPLSTVTTSSIVNSSTLVFNTPTGDQLTYAQTISGSGGLTVIGGGSLFLNGTNTYEGPTLITSGIVDALDNAALGVNSAVTVASGASLNFSGLVLSGLSGTYYSSGANLPNSAAFDSLPALTTYVASLPVITTDISGDTNGTNDDGGYFDYGSTGVGFPVPIQNNSTDFIGVWTGEFDAAVTGTYTFETASDDGSMLFIDGNVVVNNNAFQGITARSGSVTLTAGLHNIVIAYYQGTGDYALYADVQVPGGTLGPLPNALLLDANAQIDFGSLTGSGDINVDSSTLITLAVGSNNASTTYSGVLSGFAGLTKVGSGTLTLVNTNTYFGSTTIDSGTLIVTANGMLGSALAPGIVVNSGGALGFIGGFDYTGTEPITISGSGPAGNGAIENISGTNTFAVPITVAGTATIGADTGSLLLTGSITVSSESTLTLGGSGSIDISGSMDLTTGSLDVDTSGSDMISGVISGPGPSDLPPTDGLEYELDASAAGGVVTNSTGGVTTFVDESGNGNNFTNTGIPAADDGPVASTDPQLVSNAINGLPALQFFGAANPTELVGAPNVNAQTVIIVTETNPFDSSEDCCEGIWGDAGQDESLRFEGTNWSGNPNNGGNGGDYNFANGADGQTYITTATSLDQNTTAFTNNQPYILVATGNLTPALMQIGGGSYGDRYYDGFIGEVLVYDTVLTTAQRQQVEEYLSNKWLGTDYSLQLPAVAMTGTGTLNLSNANTYTGSTSITAGKVIVTGNGAMGPTSAAGISVNGGTLGLAGGFDYTDAEPITISGSGANGAGALENISGNNTFGVPITGSAPLTIGSAAGTLTINSLTSLLSTTPLTVVGAGTVDITSAITLGAGIVTVTDNGTGILNISGNISLPGQTAFTLAGAGTINISGDVDLGAQGGLVDSTSGTNTINGVISGTNPSLPTSPTLPDIPGLEYDLDATDSASLVTNSSGGVTQWNDLSGNGNNFSTANIPAADSGPVASTDPQLVSNAINGLPALQFFGAASPTELVGADNVNAQTVIMVTETNPFDTSENCCEGIWGYAGQDESLRFSSDAEWGSGSPNENDFIYGGTTYITTASGTSQTYSLPYNTPYIVVATTGNTGFTPTVTEIGGGSYGDRYYDGYIGQVLVYNTVLTTAQIQEVEEYLDAKWLTGIPTLAGEVTMAGSGSLTLTNANTYSGSTIVEAGSVVVTKNGAMGPATAAGIVISGGSLGFAGNVDYNTGEPVTVNGTGFDGTGAIENISGANTFTSNITLNGSATLGSDAGLLTLSGTINLGLGYTFTVTGSGNTTISGSISGSSSADASLPVILGSAGSNALEYELDASNAGSLVTTASGAVTQWDDLSGNGNNFSTTGILASAGGGPVASTDPQLVSDVFGSLPALQFFGGASPTELVGAPNVNAQTVFIVTDTLGFSNGCCDGIWGIAGTDESLRFDQDSSTSGNWNANANSGDFEEAYNKTSGSDWISTASSLDQNTPDFNYDTPYIITATGNLTPDLTEIGGGSYGGRYYNGYIGEVLVYNTVLTTAQRQEVEQYLTEKWLAAPTNNVVKTGTGTLTLSNTNTYSGSTTINGGTLAVTANGAMGPASDPGVVVNSGGALAFSGGVDYATAEPLSITGTGPAGNGAIENLSGSNTFAGAITLAANATIGSDAGALTLTATAINMNNGALTTVGAGNITITSQLQFVGTANSNGLTTNGTGTVTVSNSNNTYPGATTVNAGTLVVNGKLADTSGVAVNSGATLAGTGSFTAAAVVAGGVVNPGSPVGSPGTLSVGSMNFASNGNLTADITNTSHSLLSVTHGLTLGGTSTLTLDLAGLTSVPSGPLTIATDDTLTGQFAGLYVFNNPNDYQVAVGYTATSVTVTITATTHPTATLEADTGSNPSPDGAAATFTVSVTSASPLSGETVNIEDASNGDAVVATPTLTNGSTTFSISSLGVGSHNLFAVYTSDGTYGTSYSNLVTQVVLAPLVVNSVTATPSGFVLIFSDPINPASTVLYSSPGDTTLGAADITVVGATTGTLRGSLIIDPTNPDEATFVQTSGLLAPDTYTVTVTNRVTAVGGNELSSNFSATLTVATTTTPVLSISSFARGPGQTVALQDTFGNTVGIPIDISKAAAGVTQASFSLTYDPTLLSIAASGALTLSSAATAAGLTTLSYSITSVDAQHSVLMVTLSGGTGLTTTTPETLLTILASVPSSAIYLNKALLNLSGVTVNGMTAAGVSGVDVAAYLGDVSGSGVLNSLDASLVNQVGSGAGTGFSAFKDLDPAIIGAVNGEANVSATDASLINQAGAGATIAQIPAVPPGITLTFGGPDPYLYLSAVQGSAGQTVTETLYLDVTDPQGVQLTALDEAIGFDPSLMQISDVRNAAGLEGLGSYATASTTDNGTGALLVGQAFMGSGLPPVVPYGTDVAVLEFNVTLNADASVGSVAGLTLLQNGAVNGQTKYTAVSDNEGALTWTPGMAPSNTGNPAIDGSVTVIPTVASTVLEVGTATAPRPTVVEPVKRLTPAPPVTPISSTPLSQGTENPVMIETSVGLLSLWLSEITPTAVGETAVNTAGPLPAAQASVQPGTSVVNVAATGALPEVAQAASGVPSTTRYSDPGASLALVALGTNKATPAVPTGSASAKPSTNVLDELYRQLGVGPAIEYNLATPGDGTTDEWSDLWELDIYLADLDSRENSDEVILQ